MLNRQKAERDIPLAAVRILKEPPRDELFRLLDLALVCVLGGPRCDLHAHAKDLRGQLSKLKARNGSKTLQGEAPRARL